MTSSAAITLHNAANINIYQIPDGKYTITIYSLIKNGRFNDAVKCLRHLQQQQLQQQSTLYATAYSGGNGPKPSRSLLSLLAYCQYQDQSFQESAET
jgi:hypothetical protein